MQEPVRAHGQCKLERSSRHMCCGLGNVSWSIEFTEGAGVRRMLGSTWCIDALAETWSCQEKSEPPALEPEQWK
jgi:hypothetical protein